MTFVSVFADIGPTALYLLLGWLASGIAASWLSERKGYGEKIGLASGLLLTAAGALLWLLIPGRSGSRWGRGLIPQRQTRDQP